MKKREIKLYRIAIAFLVVCVLWIDLVFPVRAEAAIANSPVTVSQKVSSANALSVANSIQVTYTLTPENGAPMPDGTVEDVYRFTLTGNDQKAINIEYDVVGEYCYILERTGVVGTDNGTLTGEPRKVRIQSTVYGEEEFSVVTVVFILEGDSNVGSKMTELCFDYFYTAEKGIVEPTRTPNPTQKPAITQKSQVTKKPVPTVTASPSGWSRIVDAVKTGDESNAVMYLILMILAMAVGIGVMMSKKK